MRQAKCLGDFLPYSQDVFGRKMIASPGAVTDYHVDPCPSVRKRDLIAIHDRERASTVAPRYDVRRLDET